MAAPREAKDPGRDDLAQGYVLTGSGTLLRSSLPTGGSQNPDRATVEGSFSLAVGVPPGTGQEEERWEGGESSPISCGGVETPWSPIVALTMGHAGSPGRDFGFEVVTPKPAHQLRIPLPVSSSPGWSWRGSQGTCSRTLRGYCHCRSPQTSVTSWDTTVQTPTSACVWPGGGSPARVELGITEGRNMEQGPRGDEGCSQGHLCCETQNLHPGFSKGCQVGVPHCPRAASCSSDLLRISKGSKFEGLLYQ